MKIKRYIFLILVLHFFMIGYCYANESESITILNYYDFGPQAMSYELIGYEWWQWEPYVDHRPDTRYNVKVIVYRNISLEKIKELYPVIKHIHQDYRYLKYDKAVKYLEDKIEEIKELEKSNPVLYTYLKSVLTSTLAIIKQKN